MNYQKLFVVKVDLVQREQSNMEKNINDDIIKEALSYDLASDLHESWRSLRKNDDGTFAPRFKKSTDERWNKVHQTDTVDIANNAFKDLPSNWQYENLEAARVVINLVYDKVMTNDIITTNEIIQMATIIHEEWLKRNRWVLDPINGNTKLATCYQQLPKEEQEKDLSQIKIAEAKIRAYQTGLVDINALCEQYHINISNKHLIKK